MCMRPHIAHANAHAYAHVHLYLQIHTQTDTHTHVHTHAHTSMYIHTHTYTHMHTHAHVYMRANIHTQTDTRTNTRTHTYTHANTYTYNNTRIHFHTHTHTYIHTHKYQSKAAMFRHSCFNLCLHLLSSFLQRSETEQFLYESTVASSVKEVIAQLVELHNLRAKIQVRAARWSLLATRSRWRPKHVLASACRSYQLPSPQAHKRHVHPTTHQKPGAQDGGWRAVKARPIQAAREARTWWVLGGPCGEGALLRCWPHWEAHWQWYVSVWLYNTVIVHMWFPIWASLTPLASGLVTVRGAQTHSLRCRCCCVNTSSMNQGWVRDRKMLRCGCAVFVHVPEKRNWDKKYCCV